MSREFRIQNMEDPETMRSLVVVAIDHGRHVIEAGREQTFSLHAGASFVISDRIEDASNLVSTFTAGAADPSQPTQAETQNPDGVSHFNNSSVMALVQSVRDFLHDEDGEGIGAMEDALKPFDRLVITDADVPYGTPDPTAPAGPLSDDQVSRGAATPTALPGSSETPQHVETHQENTQPFDQSSEASELARSSASGGGIGVPVMTVANSDIEDGNRPEAHEANGARATGDQTGSAGTAEAFDEAQQFKDGTADQLDVSGYKVKHRGAGSYSVMDEAGNEVVDGLRKADADAFREMTATERSDFIKTSKAVRDAEQQEQNEDAAPSS